MQLTTIQVEREEFLHSRILERSDRIKSDWLQISNDLKEIKKDKLYLRKAKTFEEYCKVFFDLNRDRAYRLIAGGEVIENLNVAARLHLPKYEYHARPLTKLEPELQRQAWTEVIEENEPENITAKIITAKVETKKELNKAVREVKRDNMPNTIFVQTPLTEKEILKKAKEIKEKKKEIKTRVFYEKKNEWEKEIIPAKNKRVLVNSDCLAFIDSLENKSIDLFLSDPPYAMNFKSGWSSHKKIKNDSFEGTLKIINDSLKRSIPKTKDEAHFYIFSNMRYISDIRPIVEKYLKIKNILIWDRGVIGMGDLKSYGYSYDIIIFGHKKGCSFKDLNGTRERDVLKFNRIVPQAEDHPTPKPLDLLEYIIKKSSNEFDNILDPFLGGGSTIKAAINTNRNIFGAEIDKTHFDNYIKKYT